MEVADGSEHKFSHGVMVTAIIPEKPAASAGLRVGDLVRARQERVVSGTTEQANY